MITSHITPTPRLAPIALLLMSLAAAACEVGISAGSSAARGAAAAGPEGEPGTRGGEASGGGTPADGAEGTSSPPPSSESNPQDPGTAAPTDGATPSPVGTGFQDRYTFRGRFDFTEAAGPRFAWPNSAIGATFTGSSLSLQLADPLATTYNGQPVNNRYDVTIDQRPPVVVTIAPGVTDYPVASDLPAGNHTVWVSKRTEANIGRGQFFGMTLAPGGSFLTPPAAKARFIEFIGDSASSGYGLDGNYPVWNGCTFSAATANSSLAYPAVTAAALGADFHNVAFAGKGITRNLSPRDPVLTMPVIYNLWDPRDPKTPYTFARPAADVVVINIGGNDWTGDGPVHIPPDQRAFTDKYLGLIKSAQQHAPMATVFCAVTSQAHGVDRDTYRSYLQGVVAEAAALGDVQFFEFAEYNGALGWGCDGHPNAAAAAKMAQQLTAAVKTARGW